MLTPPVRRWLGPTVTANVECAAERLAAELRKDIEATIAANLAAASKLEAAAKDRVTSAHFHRRTDELVEKHTPLVHAAMAQVFEGDTVRHAIRAAYTAQKALPTPGTGAQATNTRMVAGTPVAAAPGAVGASAAVGGVGALGAAGAATLGGAAALGGGALAVGGATVGAAGALGTALAILAHAIPATAALSSALRGIYSDAWLAGSEAAGAAGAIMPTGTDAEVAAALLSDGGLALLLEERGAWVQEITHTQMERIGNAIARGIETGASRKDTIAAVEAIIHDAGRARMIADTETTRALAAAAMHRYRESNIQQIRWLAHPNCCDRCKVNAHAGPKHNGVIYIWESWPMGPIPVHPNERCAVAPYPE